MSRYVDIEPIIARHTNAEYKVSDISFAEVLHTPSIDIVRCRECKHREEYPCKVYHEDDWYCADGEREDE